MGRPFREVEPRGFYHFGSRGNNRQPIYWDAFDYAYFIDRSGKVTRRYGWTVFAYCLMPNHFHFVVQIDELLSEPMQVLNTAYANRTNRRYGRVGHLFQNRFFAEPLTTERRLKSAIRYVVLNPVRAGLCQHPEQWRWSSHRACLGLEFAPPGLNVDATLRLFSSEPETARAAYAALIDSGHDPVSDTGGAAD